MAMLSPKQACSFALILLIFPGVFRARSSRDPEATPYRSATSEVRITFFATDERNRLMTALTRDDFAVVDSGIVIRDFRSLTHSNETSLDLMILVDESESVNSRFAPAAKIVQQLVQKESGNVDDTISVIAFSGLRPRVVCERNCAFLEPKFFATAPAGQTPLFDTLRYAAQYAVDHQIAGVRQAVLLFSDGNDTISRTSASDALKALIQSGAVLYGADLNEPSDFAKGSATLQKLAEATGGRSFFLRDTPNALESVLADMQASYVVTYPLPTHVAGFHSLRILPKHNLNLRFHCRGGYYYEESH